MNVDVFILFFNATLTTMLSAVIVLVILRRRYLPVIRRLEAEQGVSAGADDPGESGRASERASGQMAD